VSLAYIYSSRSTEENHQGVLWPCISVWGSKMGFGTWSEKEGLGGMEIRKSVGWIPMALPHLPSVWSGRNIGIWLHSFDFEFSPQTVACFFMEKSVNAWPALAERLHTSTKLNPQIFMFIVVVNMRSKCLKGR